MIKGVLAAVVLATVSSGACAEFHTGNSLMDSMREYKKHVAGASGVNYIKASFFQGYVGGAADAVQGEYCNPDPITGGQAMSIVAKYMDDNPDKWGKAANVLVKDALKQAFPCK